MAAGPAAGTGHSAAPRHADLGGQPRLHCHLQEPVSHVPHQLVDIQFHFTREKVRRGDVALEYVATSDQTADVLTKPRLAGPAFIHHRGAMGLAPPPVGDCWNGGKEGEDLDGLGSAGEAGDSMLRRA